MRIQRKTLSDLRMRFIRETERFLAERLNYRTPEAQRQAVHNQEETPDRWTAPIVAK